MRTALRALVAVAAWAVALGASAATSPAQAAGSPPAYVELSPRAVYPGGTSVASASGFAPHEVVQVRLDGAAVSRTPADAHGVVEVAVKTATATVPGPQRVELMAVAGAGAVLSADLGVVPGPVRDAVLLDAAPPTRAGQVSGTVPLDAGSGPSPTTWRLLGAAALVAAAAVLLRSVLPRPVPRPRTREGVVQP
jgi:hypothetical protein